MKFVAILVFLYFMLGLFAGIYLFDKTGAWTTDTSVSEKPPFVIPLVILLVAILPGLPVLGYIKAKKNAEFLKFSPKVWLILPASLFILGLAAGFVVVRVL